MSSYTHYAESILREKRRENNLRNQEIEQWKAIRQSELEAKDRVDISLKEYEELKQAIADGKLYHRLLQEKINQLTDIYKQMGFPVEAIEHIIQDSIFVCESYDFERSVRKYRVEFEIPACKFRGL